MKYLTASQMERVDDLAMGKFRVDIFQMLENAGRNLARFVSDLKPRKVIVFFGKGNNGAGGLVAARHLLIYGNKVEIVGGSKFNNSNVRYQLKILSKLGVIPQKSFKAGKGDIMIDALLGYHILGDPKGNYANLIGSMNLMKLNGGRIVSLDIPSGIDPDKGQIHDPYIKADYTLTLALPKVGLKKLKHVYLANIGIPNDVYESMGIKVENYFKKKDIVKIH